jgi:hypothetical protein
MSSLSSDRHGAEEEWSRSQDATVLSACIRVRSETRDARRVVRVTSALELSAPTSPGERGKRGPARETTPRQRPFSRFRSRGLGNGLRLGLWVIATRQTDGTARRADLGLSRPDTRQQTARRARATRRATRESRVESSRFVVSPKSTARVDASRPAYESLSLGQ